MLSAGTRAALDRRLEAYQQRTGHQVIVWIGDTTGGEALEPWAAKTFQAWGIGRKGHDDGVAILVLARDRRMRIEVGYGLEGTLTDLESHQILDDVIRPRFRNGDFAGGIEAGVDAIAAAIRGEALPQPPAELEPGFGGAPLPMRFFFAVIFLVVVGTFSLAALSAEGCQGWFLYLFLMPFYVGFPGVIFGTPIAAFAAWLLWAIGFPLLKRWRKTPKGKRFWQERMGPTGAGRWFAVGPGGGWSSRGGGWGGGGGFSGGGGGFGGGGSSGGW
jgi:uncharacterized protein